MALREAFNKADHCCNLLVIDLFTPHTSNSDRIRI